MFYAFDSASGKDLLMLAFIGGLVSLVYIILVILEVVYRLSKRKKV